MKVNELRRRLFDMGMYIRDIGGNAYNVAPLSPFSNNIPTIMGLVQANGFNDLADVAYISSSHRHILNIALIYGVPTS